MGNEDAQIVLLRAALHFQAFDLGKDLTPLNHANGKHHFCKVPYTLLPR